MDAHGNVIMDSETFALCQEYLGDALPLTEHLSHHVGLATSQLLEVKHLARLGPLAIAGARDLIFILMELEIGTPDSFPGAGDGVPGFGLLPASVTAASLQMPIIDLTEAAIARGVALGELSKGTLAADAMAEALSRGTPRGGGSGSTSRAKALAAHTQQGLIERGYGAGIGRPE